MVSAIEKTYTLVLRHILEKPFLAHSHDHKSFYSHPIIVLANNEIPVTLVLFSK